MSQAFETPSNDNVTALPDLLGTQPQIRPALPVPVHYGELLLTGWAIKRDTVLVRASGFTGEISVDIDGECVMVDSVHEMIREDEGWEPLSALQLPVGTLGILGEAFPPGIEPPAEPGNPAVYAFWCRLLPRIRGC